MFNSMMLLNLLVIIYLSLLIPARETSPNSFVELVHGVMRIYDQVDRHLNRGFKRRLLDDGEATNMNEAISWLETRASSTGCLQFNKGSIIEALRQLRALRDMKNDNECNKTSYDILKRVDVATRGKAHQKRFSPVLQCRRIDKVVQYYLKQHAIACRKIYSQLLKDKSNTLDARKVSIVNEIANGFINGNMRRFNLSWWNPASFYVDWTPIEASTLKKALVSEDERIIEFSMIFQTLEPIRNPLSLLKHLSREDPNRKSLDSFTSYETTRATVEELYTRYLLEPCKYYIREMDDLLTMIHFDEQMLDAVEITENEQGSFERSLPMLDFYIDYVGLSFCERLMKHPTNRLFERFMSEILKL